MESTEKSKRRNVPLFDDRYGRPKSFLQLFTEFELYWGAVFFLKICSHIFMIFEVKLE